MNCISVSFDTGTDHVDATGEFDEAGVLVVRSATVRSHDGWDCPVYPDDLWELCAYTGLRESEVVGHFKDARRDLHEHACMEALDL